MTKKKDETVIEEAEQSLSQLLQGYFKASSRSGLEVAICNKCHRIIWANIEKDVMTKEEIEIPIECDICRADTSTEIFTDQTEVATCESKID